MLKSQDLNSVVKVFFLYTALMERAIELKGQQIMYIVRNHPWAKRVRLGVSEQGRVVVTKPKRVPHWFVERVLHSNAQWVLEQLQHASPAISDQQYQRYHRHARRFVQERLAYFNIQYGFVYGRVAIRRQRTRWGSCSKKGNLNFNYRIVFLPAEVADYVIVHELCHLKEMNHSSRFWKLVEQAIPNYRQLRRVLKTYAL